MPRRRPNATPEAGALTEAEVERLMEAAKGSGAGRWSSSPTPTFRAGRPPLGSGGSNRHPARPQGQRLQHASDPRRRAARCLARAEPVDRAPSAVHQALPAGRAEPKRSWASKPTRTCCGTHAATRSPTRATTPGHFKPTSGTATSSTRCAIPNWHRRGSRTSGDAKPTTPAKGPRRVSPLQTG